MELKAVGLDLETGGGLDLLQQIRRKLDVEVADVTGFETSEMAVGIGAMAVEATTGTVKALDHPVEVKRFEVLIHRGVADAPAVGIELLEDVAGAEMTSGAPENLQH